MNFMFIYRLDPHWKVKSILNSKGVYLLLNVFIVDSVTLQRDMTIIEVREYVLFCVKITTSCFYQICIGIIKFGYVWFIEIS